MDNVLVVEDDAVVTMDLVQLLEDRFPGASVHTFQSIKDARAASAQLDPTVTVIGLSRRDVRNSLELGERIDGFPGNIVFVGDDPPPGLVAGDRRIFVRRPFTSDAILQALVTVSGVQPTQP